MAYNVRIKKQGVTLAGRDLPIGEIVELSEAAAKRFIASKHAEAVEGQGSLQDGAGGTDDQNHNGDGDPGTGAENGGNTGGSEKTPEELEAEAAAAAAEEHAKIVKAIDDKNKRDELYDEAKAQDIEIAHDIKKAELIEKIIAGGKYDHLI